MKRVFSKWSGFAGLAVLGAGFVSLFVHPFGPVKEKSASAGSLLQGAHAEPEVVATLQRACQNCHSMSTRWPWYSYVPPVSWLIENDVATARGHMDLGAWPDYSPQERVERLSKISSLVRNHIMPPPRYVLLHPEARLNNAAIDLISKWTHQERARLNTPRQSF